MIPHASIEQVFSQLNWSFDLMDEEGRQQFYNNLIKATQEPLAFINTAAEQGYAVKIGIAA